MTLIDIIWYPTITIAFILKWWPEKPKKEDAMKREGYGG